VRHITIYLLSSDNKGEVKMKHDYLVKPVYIQERKGDYSLLEKIKNFEWVDEDADGCGNVCSFELKVNKKTHRPSFGKKRFMESGYEEEEKKYVGFYQAIPSCLLLYRLGCLFEGRPNFEGPEGYKVTWSFSLLHTSGWRITFGEWKGSALFWLEANNSNELPKDFKKDVLKLLGVLLHKNCPHPYDSLVAGSVA
jgi:hypothetical protein